MSRKVMLAFLGTGDYKTCTYKMPSGESFETNFMLKALALSVCKNWTENDRIYVFITDKAKSKNWDDSTDSQNNVTKGLCRIIDELNLKVKHEGVNIPDAVTEKNIWDIFSIIYGKLQDHDELYIDITHGFRASPLLLMTLVNYSSFLKGTAVKGIFYGAEQATVSEKGMIITPVWNLNDIALLNEWTSAANEYMSFGDSERLKKLAEKSALPGLQQGTREERKISLSIMNLARALLKTSENLATARGIEIYESETVETVRTNISEIETTNLLPPFTPFIGKIRSKLEGFKPHNISNFLPAVKYCITHNLVQQGITILQEGIISYILNSFGYAWRTRNSNEQKKVLENRKNASNSLNYLSNPRNEDFRPCGEHGAEILEKIKTNKKFSDLAGIYNQLTQYRNNINHAGFICPYKPSEFVGRLKELYARTEEIITGTDKYEDKKIREKILINLSNHPHGGWEETQKAEALKFGRIIDIPFPAVDPYADESEIRKLAYQLFEQCLDIAGDNELTVHVMGEMTLTYSVVSLLKEAGVRCIASTTGRKATIENGIRISEFSFVHFREYL